MPPSRELAIPYPKTMTVGRTNSSCFRSCFQPSSAGSSPACKRLKPHRDVPLGVSALQPRLRNVTSRSGNAAVIISSIQPAYCSCSMRASPRKATRSPFFSSNDSARHVAECPRRAVNTKSVATLIFPCRSTFISSHSKVGTMKTARSVFSMQKSKHRVSNVFYKNITIGLVYMLVVSICIVEIRVERTRTH